MHQQTSDAFLVHEALNGYGWDQKIGARVSGWLYNASPAREGSTNCGLIGLVVNTDKMVAYYISIEPDVLESVFSFDFISNLLSKADPKK